MIDNRTAPYAALVLRVALGVMFLAHGLTKLLVFTPAGTAGFFQSVGFPGFLAYPVIAFEILGGAMLVLGVYGRYHALTALEAYVLLGERLSGVQILGSAMVVAAVIVVRIAEDYADRRAASLAAGQGAGSTG